MSKKISLTQQLADAKANAEYYRGKYEAVSKELSDEKDRAEKERRNTMSSLDHAVSEAVETNRQLMEVVRWHVNPETAKLPEVTGRDMRERFR